MPIKNIEKMLVNEPLSAVDANTIMFARELGKNKDSAGFASSFRQYFTPLTNEKEYTSAGTVYALTATSANVSFGTSGVVQVSIDQAGKYKITAEFVVNYNGATFAAVRDLTARLRRSNNTPADVAGSIRTIKTDIVTTKTSTLAYISITAFYTASTAAPTTPDTVGLFANISVLPTAGTLEVVSAFMRAERLQT